MKNFYINIKKILDNSSKKIKFKKNKNDSSMLTENDLIVQKKIINLIKKYFSDVDQFVCEENFSIKKFEKINFREPFAIIDPIDGTENFFSNDFMFGCLVSIFSKKKGNVDLIYIPKINKMITRNNFKRICKKPKKKNKITILSTKCLGNKKYKGSIYRMYGSSAYSFYQLITGKANSFIYCDGSKIWDCFTGLRLLSLTNCKLNNEINKWITKPSPKLKFTVKWN